VSFAKPCWARQLRSDGTIVDRTQEGEDTWYVVTFRLKVPTRFGPKCPAVSEECARTRGWREQAAPWPAAQHAAVLRDVDRHFGRGERAPLQAFPRGLGYQPLPTARTRTDAFRLCHLVVGALPDCCTQECVRGLPCAEYAAGWVSAQRLISWQRQGIQRVHGCLVRAKCDHSVEFASLSTRQRRGFARLFVAGDRPRSRRQEAPQRGRPDQPPTRKMCLPDPVT
jgi:hypothetical protein